MARTVRAEVYTVRRDAFIDTALRLMQAKGYEQMSIQDVLDQLEASRGAFYHYFDSKQALLEAVIERMVDVGLAVVEPVAGDPGLSALQKLTGVFGGIARWKTERRALVLALLDVWLSDDHAIVREKFRHSLSGRLVPQLTKIVEQGVAEGVFKVSSPEATAQIIVMFLLGFQDVATQLFVARQAGTVGYDEVVARFKSYTDAFERILGAPKGSVDMVDESVMQAWFAQEEGAASKEARVGIDHRS